MGDDYESLPTSWQEYEEWREHVATYGRPPAGIQERVELVREQRALSADRMREYDAGRAFYEARAAFEKERADAREQFAKLKMGVATIQADRDAKAAALSDSRQRLSTIVAKLVELHDKVQPALLDSYEKAELKAIMEEAIQVNSKLSCPICDHKPTYLYCGVAVCPNPNCKWDETKPTPEQSG